MAWNKVVVREKIKKHLINLKKEKGLSEGDLVEYALLKTFGKQK